MTPADLAATHAAAFPAPQVWSEADFAALLAQPGTILTGDARSFVLGRVTLDEAEILTLATRPEARRQGRARARLDAFAALARDRGAAAIYLEVAADNIPARALYATAGFTETGRRRGYYRNADGSRGDALVLRRALAP